MGEFQTRRQNIVLKGEWSLDGTDSINGPQGKIYILSQNWDFWFELSRIQEKLQPNEKPNLNANGEAFYVVIDEEDKFQGLTPMLADSPTLMSLIDAKAWASEKINGSIFWEKDDRIPSQPSFDRRGHVFVSYMREDEATVTRIVRTLNNNNIRVWMDRNSINPGELWPSALSKAIADGSFFLAFFSKSYNKRRDTYMDEEIKVAADLLASSSDTTWFVPVLLEPCQLPKIRIGLKNTIADVHAIDFSNFELGMESLLNHIGGSGILMGDGPIEQRLAMAAEKWKKRGRIGFLLKSEILLVAKCWQMHMERIGKSIPNQLILEYIQASYDAIGDNGWIYMLHRRKSCFSCGTSFKVENLGICTDCFNYYCFNCHDKHSNCSGVIVG